MKYLSYWLIFEVFISPANTFVQQVSSILLVEVFSIFAQISSCNIVYFQHSLPLKYLKLSMKIFCLDLKDLMVYLVLLKKDYLKELLFIQLFFSVEGLGLNLFERIMSLNRLVLKFFFSVHRSFI